MMHAYELIRAKLMLVNLVLVHCILYMHRRQLATVVTARMCRFGGVYVDLDIECLKAGDGLLKDRTLVVTMLGQGPNISTVTNAIMASTAGHPFLPFWLMAIAEILHRFGQVRLRKCRSRLK